MNMRILAVDDSRSMLEVLSSTLMAAGFEVVTATNGEDALARIGEQTFRLVITDLYMPKLDGVGLTRALRQREDTRFLPILMLTTESQSTKKAVGREAGATGWIVKPFSPDQLVAVVRKLLS